MSRHFELMQAMGVPQDYYLTGGWAATVPGEADYQARAAALRERLLIAADNARIEEILKLVHHVFLLPDKPPRSAVFAGVDHKSGCSQACMHAAEILCATSQKSVCLVEGNLRSPSLDALFGIANRSGLVNALSDEGPIRSFTKPIRGESLWLLSAGQGPTEYHALNSGRLKVRVAELREEFDFVLIDAPPLGRYSDALTLAQLSEGMILVLEANATRREAARRASESLRAAGIDVLAAVLNKRTFPIPKALYSKL
jgi:Mrp family chromosome partitioning ATPase